MRVVALAYSDVGCACLDVLLHSGDELVAVYTHTDDPDEEIWFGSVEALAQSHGIPVFRPDDINRPEWVERIREQAPDVIFSFYYRKLVCREILDIPRLGAMNVHGSLLPRYRGRCPVNWVLVHGETETGVTLHQMVEKPDAGDIVAQRAIPIEPTDSAGSLQAKLAAEAARMLEAALPAIRSGTHPSVPQDLSAGSYFGARTPEDGRIDWTRPAAEIYDLVRAVAHPFPGAFTHLEGRRLFVWWAEPEAARPDDAPVPGELSRDDGMCVGTGQGWLWVRRCQLEGEEELTVEAFLARHGPLGGVLLC